MRYSWMKLLLFIGVLCAQLLDVTLACSRVLVADKEQSVMVGRNMDWSTDLAELMQTNLLVLPRGLARSGKAVDNPLLWTSKYGSVIATALHDTIATDGMNERGLAVHTLWLSNADYGKRDTSLPGLSIAMWVQYFLDNFASVDEAVRFVETHSFQVVPFIIPGTNKPAPQHLALEDASGDSAILEYTHGKQHVYHASQYTVLTNEPTYDKQLRNLRQYIGFGGHKPLPGTISPKDRFVRLAYYSSRLPKATSLRDEVSKVFSLLQSSAEPFEMRSEENPNPIPTIWQVVADLTHKTYYLHTIDGMSLMWLALNDFNLQAGAPVMKLDIVNHPELAGEISKGFKEIELPE